MHSDDDDDLVPVRCRIPARLSTALAAEALAQRTPAGHLLADLLRRTLPEAAAERVRREIAAGDHLRVVRDETP